MAEEKDIKNFRDRMISLRLQKNVSEQDMSLSIGKSHSDINQLDSGRLLPKMDAFLDICDFYGITPEQFFAYYKEQPILENKIIQLLSLMGKADLEYIYNISAAIVKKKDLTPA